MAIGDITERWVVQKRSLTDGSLTWTVQLSSVNTLNFYPKSITVAEDGVWIVGSIGTSPITSRSGYVEKRDKTTGVLSTAFYVTAGVSAVLDGVHSSEAITFIAGAKKEVTGEWKWYMAAIGAASLINPEDLMRHLKWFEDEVFMGSYLLTRARYHDYSPSEQVHTILPPVVPVGESTGVVGSTCYFSVAFTECEPNHSDQISVDWDDGTISDYVIAETSPVTISYTWVAAGVYNIRARAMCRNTGIVSSWSDALTVTQTAQVELVPVPAIPVGESTGVVGVTQSFSITFTKCNPNHSVQIMVDWDDGTTPVLTTAQYSPITISHSWALAGTYHIKAQSRCVNTGVPSAWSATLTVTQTNASVDPAIPTIRYKIGVNYERRDMIAAGQLKQYYINLPNELPLIDTPTMHRDALLLGQNYGQFEINIVDYSHVAEFNVTITNPHGEIFHPSISEGLAFIKFQNASPAYPGRYLLSITAQIPAPYTQSPCWISWGCLPSPLPEELTD